MLLADQLGCESIAFPLIATGVYGFPKDRALETALDVIVSCCIENDLFDIYRVNLLLFEHDQPQLP